MSDTRFGRRPHPNPALVATDIERAGNTEFMEALVAACAIISCSDGEVASAERRRFLTLARSEPRLAAFSFEELAEEFASHTATIEMDPEMGSELAYEKLAPFRTKRREAYVIVETCRHMIPADGVVHPAEQMALARLRESLGLEPDDGAPALAMQRPQYNPRHLPVAV